MRDVNKYIQEVREYESGWREFELTNGFVLSVAPTVREEVAMFMVAAASSDAFTDRYQDALRQELRNSLDRIVAIRPHYHGEVPVPWSFREATTTEDEFGVIKDQADVSAGPSTGLLSSCAMMKAKGRRPVCRYSRHEHNQSARPTRSRRRSPGTAHRAGHHPHHHRSVRQGLAPGAHA